MSNNFKYLAIITFIQVFVLNKFSVLGQQTEIVYNLAKIGSFSEKISENCRNDLEQIVNSINGRELWAMKLLDASGKFGSGFIWGNNFLLGDQFGCSTVHKPIYISQTRHLNPLNPTNLLSECSPFPVEYRMIYIRHTSPLQYDSLIYDRKILHLGLCFPQSCRDVDTIYLANHYFVKYDKYVGREMIGTNVTVLRTKTLKLRPNFWNDTFVQMLIWITIFNLVNIAVGTLYTYNIERDRLNSMKKEDDNKQVKRGIIERWFSSFSLIENTKMIFINRKQKAGDNSIKIVHSMRALGMFLLVMAHVLFFSINPLDNFETTISKGDIWYYQPVATGFLGVDTFVVIGGFLLSFLYFERLKTVKKNENGMVLIIKAIISRYIRLTPLHFIVILMTYTLNVYLKDTSPFEVADDYERNCNERFWFNLLYINNLFPLLDSCMIWSWYLGHDFQCFVIAVIVLVVFTRNNKLGIWLGTGISLASMAVSMYFAAKVKYSLAADNIINTVDVMYITPWNRLAAYFVAVVAGRYFSMENRQLRLSKFYIVLGWIIAQTIFISITFLHVYKADNLIFAVLYSGFVRILWSIATCWLLIACASNNGGFLTKIFESKIWIPFSRMSFACYLINPVAILPIVMLPDTALHFNFALYIVESFGFIALSFLASYVMVVVYEAPFHKLITAFIVQWKKDVE